MTPYLLKSYVTLNWQPLTSQQLSKRDRLSSYYLPYVRLPKRMGV